MEFAWVRFHKGKEETCLPVAEIGVKEKLANGLLKINPFQPKDENDFVTTKWYFAKKNTDKESKSENVVWSRIIVLYLGATRDYIDTKRETNQRIKYVNPKCIQSESSFEEDFNKRASQCSVQKTLQKKKASTKRAKDILKAIEQNFEVPQFLDLEEKNFVYSGTSALKEPIVCLKKLKSTDNNNLTNQTLSPESPSLLGPCNRKSLESLVDKTPTSSRASRPRTKIPRLSSSGSESDGAHHRTPSKNLLNKQVQLGKKSLNTQALQNQTSPSSSTSSEFEISSPEHQSISESRSPNRTPPPQSHSLERIPPAGTAGTAAPEHTPPPGRKSPSQTPSRQNQQQHTPTPPRQSPIQPRTPQQTPPGQNQQQHTPTPPRQSPIQPRTPQQTPPGQNQRQHTPTPPRYSPQHEPIPQNVEADRPRRIKYYKMAEYVKHCIDYYNEKRETEHAYQEMRSRYTIQNGNEMYLGEGHSINVLQWELLQAHKPPVFLVELAIHLWGERALTNRALDLTRGVENIPTRSPVKLIEKEVLRLLISLYSDFLNRNNYPNNEKVSYLLRATYVLRHKIRDLRSAEKKKHRPQNVNPRKRLRYNVKN